MNEHGIGVNAREIQGWADAELRLHDHHRSRSIRLRYQAKNWVWYSIPLVILAMVFHVLLAAVVLGYILYAGWRYVAWKEHRKSLVHGAKYIEWREIVRVW